VNSALVFYAVFDSCLTSAPKAAVEENLCSDTITGCC